MRLKEFIKRIDEVRRKYDILLLTDLIQLYEEKYKNKKEKVPIEYIFNELHDDLIYTEQEKDFIISEALKHNKRSIRGIAK